MAQLQSTNILGTFTLSGATQNTGNVGNLWYNPIVNRLQYSYTGFGAGTWSAGGALITASSNLAGAGTQNAGLAFGNVGPSCTEEYNGSSWSAGGALITARYGLAGSGTQNAGLAFGGYSSPSVISCTEEYNGTSWTAGGALITARQSLAGAGTQNAGLAFGGQSSTILSCTEEYNESEIICTCTL